MESVVSFKTLLSVVFSGTPETNTDHNMFITRFKNWGDGPFNWPCHGQRVSFVCILSVGDLPLLASRPEMFANKFYLDYEPLALDCMEELHFNRTRSELLGKSQFDTSLYEELSYVKNHIWTWFLSSLFGLLGKNYSES